MELDTEGVYISWPLVPWDPVYKVSERGVTKRRVIESQEKDLILRQTRWEDVQLPTLEILQKARQQAYDRYLLEKDRTELFNLKVESGQISPQDGEFQKIQMENTHLDWMRARLTLLVFTLVGE